MVCRHSGVYSVDHSANIHFLSTKLIVQATTLCVLCIIPVYWKAVEAKVSGDVAVTNATDEEDVKVHGTRLGLMGSPSGSK